MMLIKIFLVSAFIAASANAGWVWKDDKNEPSGARFRRMTNPTPQFPNIAFPGFPNVPLALPGMPNFGNLFPHINFPNIKFPEIKMPEIKFISPEEIAAHKEPGYTGVSMVSTSDGGTTYTVNKGGKIETFTVPAGTSNTKTSSIVAAAMSN
ncbi:seroin-like [Maniola jurtina]|uniref:seroin-like n=1 Tax=Maniola jurtina TaxID=191418 RepID=UPI001E68F8DB|nr:seroin-like [Maniola jurtina]